jgi:NAD(P)-dependent dehydrogenase (short-subunit alcohol dehydrogenase family)
MPKHFEQKSVVVTGASSGVGRAVARAFGEQGARVALIARNAEALEHAAREIREAGGEAMVLPLDVADAAAVSEAADTVAQKWGGIDVWVNDAMVTVFGAAKDVSPEEFKRVTEVNYLGAVYGTLAALRHMRQKNAGTIVQIGSALAYRSIPLQSAYCGSKAAMRGFTDSLRCELRHDKSKVRITMLQLPAVNTPQFDVARLKIDAVPQPVPPIFQPEVIGRAAVYAARKAPRELWIAKGAIQAILGQKIIPGLLDRFLARKGYSGQITDQRPRPNRPDNLFRPAPYDPGAHGRYDSSAKSRSVELWLRTHPKTLLGAVVGSAALSSLASPKVRSLLG